MPPLWYPVMPRETYCPNCRCNLKKKGALTPFIVIAGLIVVVILIVAVVMMSPTPGLRQLSHR